jgi:hypothetical protein
MTMTRERGPRLEALSEREVAAQAAEALPNREVMSTVGADPTGWENLAMPINEALALNYESTYSIAFAEADQMVITGALGDVPDETTASDPTQGG